ncbi:hypothetical protein SAMD00023353_0601740 [Rosellinia necatrix]|uniref:Uncharacterized protein n=1 Tax=Rosellinia necatrix TaxID=77044 RepID=A0A1S8A5Q9_ROSNE|nr:hypothetical protein SAMD00023353_0601740 [Rosellinia necatrix]
MAAGASAALSGGDVPVLLTGRYSIRQYLRKGQGRLQVYRTATYGRCPRQMPRTDILGANPWQGPSKRRHHMRAARDAWDGMIVVPRVGGADDRALSLAASGVLDRTEIHRSNGSGCPSPRRD